MKSRPGEPVTLCSCTPRICRSPRAELLSSTIRLAGSREAKVLYEQVLAEHPDHADALHLCGLIAHQRGQHASAAELIQRAIALKPNFPQAYCNLGERPAGHGPGRMPPSPHAARAIAFRPGLPEAHGNLETPCRTLEESMKHSQPIARPMPSSAGYIPRR